MKGNNIFVKAVFFVVLAITLTVGVTYAYFKVNITGLESTSTISIGGATLKIVYEGTETITAENIIPGWSAKKYFNVDVTNTSGKDISYDINLVVLNSNFYTTSDLGNSYLEYALYECESSTDKTCERKIQSASILDIQSGSKLVNSVTTNTSSKTYYALELSFSNQDAVQSQTGADGNTLTFSGYVTLVSSDKVYDATPVSFAEDSWETIALVVKKQKELSSSVYKVGDEKEVTIDGADYTVRIANNSNYDCDLDSKTACGFVVEFVDITTEISANSFLDIADTLQVQQLSKSFAVSEIQPNKGGWPATNARDYLNNTLYNMLPSDLRSIIANTTVISGHGTDDYNPDRVDGNWESVDKLYLLSSGEIWSDCLTSDCYDTASHPSGGNGATTRQLDYYANNSVTTSSNYSIANKNNNYWWLRSAYFGYSGSFIVVDKTGKKTNYGATSGFSYGISPAFRIGEDM